MQPPDQWAHDTLIKPQKNTAFICIWEAETGSRIISNFLGSAHCFHRPLSNENCPITQPMREFSGYRLDDKAYHAWQGKEFEGTNGNIPSPWEK